MGFSWRLQKNPLVQVTFRYGFLLADFLLADKLSFQGARSNMCPVQPPPPACGSRRCLQRDLYQHYLLINPSSPPPSSAHSNFPLAKLCGKLHLEVHSQSREHWEGHGGVKRVRCYPMLL